ncbi:hypothetical protein GGQ99_001318 [Aminobacter niigataensis]|uniref:Uncharacterized protein n=1 Tax=Aminobacter niigataensis TaxID=83265 RepID=A0ABR6KYV4_9HYPH|nr:hypothetical protein [Aminobacter niigataensis]MBB4649596.1 hypothetical protein [Aminobacter niigataensis]
MKNSENHLWFAVLVSGALGIILGVAWMDLDHQAKWLYDYQTLITGIAAVGAAFITVSAMSRSEERQQQRHDELMKLNLRADRLRARRAAYPHSEQLEQSTRRLEKAIAAYGQDQGQANDARRQKIRKMLSLRSLIISILHRESIVEAKDLFGSAMAFTLQRIEADFCADAEIFRMAGDYTTSTGGASDYTISLCDMSVERMSDNIADLQAFAGHLNQLAGYYGE